MECGSEVSVHESVEDNEEFNKVPAVEKSEIIGESSVHDNGSCELENNDDDDDDDIMVPSDAKGKAEMTPEVSLSTSSTKKGFGLKKWKRIKRDLKKSGDTRGDSGKMLIPPKLSESGANPSKRAQIYAEKQQKSEGSVSSTNPLVGSLDFFLMLGDSAPSIDAGADSENSEDLSSRSSTAASVPKVRHDKSRIKSPSGKNLAHSSQRGQLGKVQSETLKKARGEQVNIKEENSHSSLESNSHSSSLAFLQGSYSTCNGMVSERLIHRAAENGDEVTGSEHRVSDGIQDGVSSPEDESTDSNCKVKTERSEKGSCPDQDPLVESIIALQAAQEALKKEVLKFKEISSDADASVDDLISDANLEITYAEQKVQETSSRQFPFGVDIETAKAELEDLFQQKIAAEVEYLTISKMMRTAIVNETSNSEEESTSASLQLENELEKIYQDLASADETMKLQKRLCKYTSCFFLQLFCLLVILGAFISRLSPDYVEVVPT